MCSWLHISIIEQNSEFQTNLHSFHNDTFDLTSNIVESDPVLLFDLDPGDDGQHGSQTVSTGDESFQLKLCAQATQSFHYTEIYPTAMTCCGCMCHRNIPPHAAGDRSRNYQSLAREHASTQANINTISLTSLSDKSKHHGERLVRLFQAVFDHRTIVASIRWHSLNASQQSIS